MNEYINQWTTMLETGEEPMPEPQKKPEPDPDQVFDEVY